ncbi:hypothetical protein PHLGIDRAFT_515405 [Phlebiopsis gigantea 11061_1 CR5-6]|uniref:Uncharacterized protein n=1 Tax=Phlebiopsis gigantea (strain 11061_1 CR5-6) TaxID=745531 RepID=A0A0C3PJP7_PHLG1|nr:hypothetical protein PHLGIDRAFT_515405 [Phlebiopsis gigantea 11061_1 CR5-6]
MAIKHSMEQKPRAVQPLEEHDCSDASNCDLEADRCRCQAQMPCHSQHAPRAHATGVTKVAHDTQTRPTHSAPRNIVDEPSTQPANAAVQREVPATPSASSDTSQPQQPLAQATGSPLFQRPVVHDFSRYHRTKRYTFNDLAADLSPSPAPAASAASIASDVMALSNMPTDPDVLPTVVAGLPNDFRNFGVFCDRPGFDWFLEKM